MAATRVGRATRWMLVRGVSRDPPRRGRARALGAARRGSSPAFTESSCVRRPGAAWLATWRESGPRAASRELREFLRRIDEWSERDLAIGRRLRLPAQRFLLDAPPLRQLAGARRPRRLALLRARDRLAHRSPLPRPRLGRAGPARRPRGRDPRLRRLPARPRRRARGGAGAGQGRDRDRPSARRRRARSIRSAIPRSTSWRAGSRPRASRSSIRHRCCSRRPAAATPMYLPTTRTGGPRRSTASRPRWRPRSSARGVLPRPASPRFHRTRETIVGHPDLVRLLGLPAEGVGPRYEAVDDPGRARRRWRGLPSRSGHTTRRSCCSATAWPATTAGASSSYGVGRGPGRAARLPPPDPGRRRSSSRPAAAWTAASGWPHLLRRRRDPLAGKRLVILELAERELAIGPLAAGAVREPAPGERRRRLRTRLRARARPLVREIRLEPRPCARLEPRSRAGAAPPGSARSARRGRRAARGRARRVAPRGTRRGAPLRSRAGSGSPSVSPPPRGAGGAPARASRAIAPRGVAPGRRDRRSRCPAASTRRASRSRCSPPTPPAPSAPARSPPPRRRARGAR